jgi:hypothetical protein
MAVDPGEHTGWATAIVPLEVRSSERLRGLRHLTTGTIVGDEVVQARVLVHIWTQFRHQSMLKYRARTHLVFEDFILISLDSSERSGISPVRVTAAFQGYRACLADDYILRGGGMAPVDFAPMHLQQPGEAKGAFPAPQLRKYGLWVRGKPHERDACRHLGLFIKRMKGINSAS